MIRAAVFIAVVAAKKTRLTPVLLFLFMGFALVNVGESPVASDFFIRELAELRHRPDRYFDPAEESVQPL